jgi:capsular polysaccharide transport system permease protein
MYYRKMDAPTIEWQDGRMSANDEGRVPIAWQTDYTRLGRPMPKPSFGIVTAMGRGLWAALRFRPLLVVVLFLPAILSAAYLLAVAADQYESEARFVVRSAARPEASGSVAFLVQLGLARSQDDSFIVEDFMASRDALDRLQAKLPLAEIYGRKEADFLTRYPSFLFGPTEEEFYRYLQYAVSVVHTDKTGISTLRVRAFRADDARRVAQTLLAAGEELVNRLNERLQRDAVGNSAAELQASQQRLIDAQAALTDFRNRELLLDPAKNAVALAELIARLSSELATTRAQVSEMSSGASASPQLIGLRRKAVALEEQIARERARIAGESDGLADRIAKFERLNMEREFANRMVTSAEADLVRVRAEATRQSLYLERVVEPHAADYPVQPKRLRLLTTVFAANALLVLIGWLILSGVREHGGRPY